MAGVNTILKHPQREEITADILKHIPYTTLAEKWGLSPGIISRYKRNTLDKEHQIAVSNSPEVVEARNRAIAAALKQFTGLEKVLKTWEFIEDRLTEILTKSDIQDKELLNVLKEFRALQADKVVGMAKLAELRANERPLSEMPEWQSIYVQLQAAPICASCRKVLISVLKQAEPAKEVIDYHIAKAAQTAYDDYQVPDNTDTLATDHPQPSQSKIKTTHKPTNNTHTNNSQENNL